MAPDSGTALAGVGEALYEYGYCGDGTARAAQAFYEKNEAEMAGKEIVELWPEVIKYLDVRKEICDVGYYPVLRELQNSTHDPSQALFDMGSAIRFEKTREGFLRADKRLIRWQEMAGATVVFGLGGW